MWKLLHLFVHVATTRPVFDPRPSSNVSYRILSFAISSQEFFRLARIFSRKLKFEYAKYSVGLCSEPVNGDYLEIVISVILGWKKRNVHGKLTSTLFLRASEIADVPLIWGTAPVPEKQPLNHLALLEFILETKTIVLVKFVQ